MPNEITPSRKRSREASESASQPSQREATSEKLQQLRAEHWRFTPDGDRQATSKAQGETAPHEDSPSATTTAQDQFQASLEAADSATRRKLSKQHLERLNKLPFLPSQDQLKMPLEGEGPSTTTTAQDHPKEVFQNRMSGMKEAMNVLKPFLEQSTAFKPLQAKIQALHFQLRTGHLTRHGASKTYQQILKLIAILPLPEHARTQVQTHLHEAMKPLQALTDPPQQDHGTGECSRSAEHGHTDDEALTRITQSFLDAACRPKLPAGQHYPPLGIFLTDAQYSKVLLHLRELKVKGSGDIPRTIYGKARKMAYSASDKGKAAVARYSASDKGKAAVARYSASDNRKAVQARYHASDQGRAASARYHASDNRKAAQARYLAKRKEKISGSGSIENDYSQSEV